ncbi:MAG: di-heme oxidoredictase family protein [Isosphaeraceae bacterium]|nr:di-heme oxidoredictase family protein [Isosphaeraceae bacterium]
MKKSADEWAATGGERLFLRTWAPEDPRARGGDGLGPVFNARSCVACHGLAGPGGGGTNQVNVELLSAVPARTRGGANLDNAKTRLLDRSPLIAIHPGFAQSGSIVLHRFGLAPSYQAWRDFAKDALTPRTQPPDRSGSFSGMLRPPQVGTTPPPEPPPPPDFRLVVSGRNTPALFGAGLIDAIPGAAIEAEEKRQAGHEVHGRVSRLKGGRIGRFGWKAQVPGLEEFVLTACANEMGLEVPNHHQAADPLGYGERDRQGLDMSTDECSALVAYVGSLPSPEEQPSPFSTRGRALFARTGCADCHRPDLGGVEGIYSDLLIHDMGFGLSDSGVYYGQEEESSPGVPKSPDWRTPPLWGVADSAPYLHDGRAGTLAEAIGFHGGEAQSSAARYAALPATEKATLLGFLRTLKVRKASRFTNRDVRLADEEFLPFVPRSSPVVAEPNWPDLGFGPRGARMPGAFGMR